MLGDKYRNYYCNLSVNFCVNKMGIDKKKITASICSGVTQTPCREFSKYGVSFLTKNPYKFIIPL